MDFRTIPREISHMSVGDLNLRPSAEYALARYMARIIKDRSLRVGDVLGMTEDQLRHIWHFGERGLKELQARIEELIVSWG